MKFFAPKVLLRWVPCGKPLPKLKLGWPVGWEASTGQKRLVGLPPTSRLTNCFRVFMFLNSLLFLRLRLGQQRHTHIYQYLNHKAQQGDLLTSEVELSGVLWGICVQRIRRQPARQGKHVRQNNGFFRAFRAACKCCLQVKILWFGLLIWHCWRENSKDFANHTGKKIRKTLPTKLEMIFGVTSQYWVLSEQACVFLGSCLFSFTLTDLPGSLL